jgi:hypothetical protein
MAGIKAGICQEKLLSYLMFRLDDLGTVKLRTANLASDSMQSVA